MIHNLTPTPDEGVDHLRHRLRARTRAAGREDDHAGPAAVDGRRRAQAPTRSSTRSRARARAASSRSRTRRRRAKQDDVGPAHEWVAPPRRDAGRARPGTCTRAASTTDLTVTRGARDEALFRSDREVLRARRGGVVGRVDDGHEPDWRIAVKARRRAQRVDHLRHAPGVVVRVDGDHGRVLRRRARRPEAKDPFSRGIDWRPDSSPTATCAENNNHGGKPRGLPDARGCCRAAPSPANVTSRDFVYGARRPHPRRASAAGRRSSSAGQR